MNFEFLLMTERSRRVKHDNALSEGTAKAGAQALSAKNATGGRFFWFRFFFCKKKEQK